MRLPHFEYHEPATLEEACRIMAELEGSARPIAGGTDLLVNMKKGLVSPLHVVGLGRIEELKEVSWTGQELRIGACRTVARLADSDDIVSSFKALSIASGSLGSPLIRNLATVGGNLVTARPAADLPPPLIACDAHVLLKSASGERRLSLEKFFLGPGLTVMRPDEILSHVLIQRPLDCSGSSYIKLGVRRALEISIVSVAAFVTLDERSGVIRLARLVLGAVAPKPMRAPSAEGILLGEKPGPKLFQEAGRAAARDSTPIDDFRGSAQYRRAMVAELTQRALQGSVDQVKECVKTGHCERSEAKS